MQYVGQAQLFTGKDNRLYGSKGRWRTHLSDVKYHDNCTYLNNAIRKYGEDAFVVTPILTCKIEKLTQYEDMFMKLLNTLVPNGYNLREAGRCGRASEETRKKMSISHSGSKHHQWGKERTEEEKERIRQTNINNAIRYDKDGTLLPKYLKYVDWASEEGYHIVSHPLCKLRKFVSTQKPVDLKQKKKLAYEFLKELNSILKECV
jgi:group I intron endonuclease